MTSVPLRTIDLVADAGAAQRLRLALDMYLMGEQKQRARLRHERPEASPEEIEKAVGEWLRSRPGALHGDAVGRPSHRFE
jgi:hypothetical protein